MDELERLKALADKQKAQKIKIEGKIESLMEDLQDEGYESVADAKKAMKTLNGKINRMENTLERKIGEFKEKYADKLSE